MQVGFLVRLEGGRLGADVAECLPDYALGFEGGGEDAGATYYMCAATRALHARFGDMLHRIHDLEARLSRQQHAARLLPSPGRLPATPRDSPL
jgi:DNA mismatch repair protein MSH5